MEKVDIMDIHTPTGGDRMDSVPPPVWDGHSGQPMSLSYTEKVRVRVPLGPPPYRNTFTHLVIFKETVSY